MSERKENIKCHVSVDDTYSAFKELCDDRYTSIWQHPFWRNLRKVHERWGCAFTLYVFDGLDKQVALLRKELMIAELRECSSWVKVAYHGSDSDDLAEFKEKFYTTKHFLSKLAGEDISAHIIRLHRFQATYDIIDYLKNEGVECLLAADDNRLSYDLCEKQVRELCSMGIVKNNSMIYLHTDVRLEKWNFFTQYCDWKKRDAKIFVLFTHECYFKKKISLVRLKLVFLLKMIHRKYDVSYVCK